MKLVKPPSESILFAKISDLYIYSILNCFVVENLKMLCYLSYLRVMKLNRWITLQQILIRGALENITYLAILTAGPLAPGCPLGPETPW